MMPLAVNTNTDIAIGCDSCSYMDLFSIPTFQVGGR